MPKFLSMLEQKSLYFALVKELGDSWEAVVARGITEGLANFYGASDSDQMVQAFQLFPSHIGVNCWYQGIGESVAMWSLYTSKGGYGVAIKSNVGRLKKSLDVSDQHVFLGQIFYEDHDVLPIEPLSPFDLHALRPLLQKRACYKHECELRALTFIKPTLPEDAQPGTVLRRPFPTHGVSVDIDLPSLIESVTLGPEFPEWAKALLKSAFARTGINPPLVESALLKPPPV